MDKGKKGKRVPASPGLRPGEMLRCIGWVNANIDGDEINRVVYPSLEEARYYAGFAHVEQVRAYIKIRHIESPKGSASIASRPKPRNTKVT